MNEKDYARFLKNVVAMPSGCHEWSGSRVPKVTGYGTFWHEGGPKKAHRLAAAHVGLDVPPDKCVMHTCDNPGCVNPEHLRIGTWADNNADRSVKGRCGDFRGEKNPGAGLTDEDVRRIRANPGRLTQKQLGVVFGCTQSCIHLIVARKSWAHVD